MKPIGAITSDGGLSMKTWERLKAYFKSEKPSGKVILLDSLTALSPESKAPAYANIGPFTPNALATGTSATVHANGQVYAGLVKAATWNPVTGQLVVTMGLDFYAHDKSAPSPPLTQYDLPVTYGKAELSLVDKPANAFQKIAVDAFAKGFEESLLGVTGDGMIIEHALPGATVSISTWKASSKGELNITFKGVGLDWEPYQFAAGMAAGLTPKKEEYELPDDPLCLHLTRIDEFGA